MTLTLTLPPELEARLIREAERHGLPVDRYVLNLLDERLTDEAVQELDDERRDWARIAEASLAAAYGEDEPEYTLDMIREPNPDYARG